MNPSSSSFQKKENEELLSQDLFTAKPEVVIWDWNGTLLNDVDICVESINILLTERKLPEITTSFYKDVFTFPVKDYYESVGFDFSKENFETPALAFMDLYIERVFSSALHIAAHEVLKSLHSQGIKQVILSAMEQQLLNNLLHHFNLIPYFEGIYGIEDHYGGGKTHRGLQLLHDLDVHPSKCLFVGDTLHDHEVANAMGCKNVLVSIGHQSADRLSQNGNIVLGSLSELIRLLNNS